MIGSKGKGVAVTGRTGPLLAAMLLLLAGLFGWSAVQQWRQANTGTQLEHARDSAL
ncbi:MAG: hypothetical protein JHC82_09370, partial [Stenotrophomonas sp.]|nr:hypothetical protein [Stenotrophomonas sp.]